MTGLDVLPVILMALVGLVGLAMIVLGIALPAITKRE